MEIPLESLPVLADGAADRCPLPAGAGRASWPSTHRQRSGPLTASRVTAGARYQAGGFHRFFLGGTYRDLWTTKIRVPVLDLHTFAGGLTVGKAGGGVQTKSLKFTTAEGLEYVFRSVDKDNVEMPPEFADVTLANRMARDQVSSSHPSAGLIVPVLLEAAGVLHETPVLVVMPDDPALGKFRKEFAHRLGRCCRSFLVAHLSRIPGFAGATDIIDSDTLLGSG